MDDFTVYGSSFDTCLDSLDRVLGRCIETNLVLNFEKCHFMVEQGIVSGHIISSRGIEIDPAKIAITSQFLFLAMQGFIGVLSRTLAKWPFHYPICCKKRWSLILMTNARRLLISSSVR